jgi:hypothetical protein
MRWAMAMLALLFAMNGHAWGYEEMEVKDGGRLTGTVKFVGEVPRLAPVPVKKNQDVCGKEKPAEALVVGPNRGVRDTAIYLEGITKGKKVDAREVYLDNTKCQFVPHVLAVMVESPAVVKNSDSILHNTHGFQDRLTVFNLALPIQHQRINVKNKLRRPGVIQVLCDAHTHMSAWVVVRDNPYFAVTDETGAFRIDNVPPGKYKVVAWHEGWKATGRDKDGRVVSDAPRGLAREVMIPARGEAAIEFELK